GINWLINRNNLDFLTAATIGIAVLIKFIFKNSYFNGLLGWLLSAGSSLYFFAIAIRAANLNISSYNRIIALLCIFAGLYQFVASHIVCELIYPLFGYPKWLSIIWNTGYLIGSGSCLLECLQETNS
ncbi:MAG: hypothetical protein IJQ28_01520, partial [Clostridia bacterium]|nr:hypothetical protein [Clostridia bacterium]